MMEAKLLPITPQYRIHYVSPSSFGPQRISKPSYALYLDSKQP
jgi:hypothetical protein